MHKNATSARPWWEHLPISLTLTLASNCNEMQQISAANTLCALQPDILGVTVKPSFVAFANQPQICFSSEILFNQNLLSNFCCCAIEYSENFQCFLSHGCSVWICLFHFQSWQICPFLSVFASYLFDFHFWWESESFIISK